MTYYRPPFHILGGRVPPVPRGIYAPADVDDLRTHDCLYMARADK